jgi:hypothetical protein
MASLLPSGTGESSQGTLSHGSSVALHSVTPVNIATQVDEAASSSSLPATSTGAALALAATAVAQAAGGGSQCGGASTAGSKQQCSSCKEFGHSKSSKHCRNYGATCLVNINEIRKGQNLCPVTIVQAGTEAASTAASSSSSSNGSPATAEQRRSGAGAVRTIAKADVDLAHSIHCKVFDMMENNNLCLDGSVEVLVVVSQDKLLKSGEVKTKTVIGTKILDSKHLHATDRDATIGGWEGKVKDAKEPIDDEVMEEESQGKLAKDALYLMNKFSKFAVLICEPTKERKRKRNRDDTVLYGADANNLEIFRQLTNFSSLPNKKQRTRDRDEASSRAALPASASASSPPSASSAASTFTVSVAPPAPPQGVAPQGAAPVPAAAAAAAPTNTFPCTL